MLYGAAFAILLPCLLALWAYAARGTVTIVAYGTQPLGAVIALAGLTLMLVGMSELWRFGGGLPMNAFPPPRLVSRGAFSYLPHPIYTGFVAACLGVSMMFRSASGLWLITPVVALGCAALVLGYERPDLTRRFGRALPQLPDADEGAPSTLERVRFIVLVIVPWILMYEFTSRLPLQGMRFGFPFEDRLPVYPWTALIYESTYVAVAIAPWFARTRRDLRQLMISAWVSMLVVFPFYWIVPSIAPRRPLLADSWIAHLLTWERTTFPPAAAFPSFHILWTVLVARLYRPKWIGWAYVIAVAITCVTTGMHYIADVISALLIAPLLLHPSRVWECLRRTAEWLANSWREWRIGPVRVINYALYAGIATLVQVGIVLAVAGSVSRWKVLVTAVAGVVGAGAWAQFIEGSSRLRRPFGFYGGLIGVGVACLLFEERWLLLAAHCTAAPWMQAIGRIRCLVNGCCHGSPTTEEIGIRVFHERSRVTHLSELTGVPIHPTQLYSILTNTMLGLILMRLWFSGSQVLLIAGIYGIGNGLARFVEEAYRGEPQTPVFYGLRLYQWMAIATVTVGAILTTVVSVAAPAPSFELNDLMVAAGFGCVVAIAMGVDLPESNRTLARLT